MALENKVPLALKKRSLRSFTVFFLSALVICGGIGLLLKRQTATNRAPAPFRQVLEFNGKLWKKLFNANRPNRPSSTILSGEPRVNGVVGLEEPLNIANWKLAIIADDQNPNSPRITLNLNDIMALPRTDTSLEFRCIEGWSEDMSFAGVKFSDFMKAYNLESRLYVGFETSDGKYYVSVDMESMMHDQTLLAYEMNGAPLQPLNGAPLRLVIPTKYGIKSIKRIGKIFFSDRRPRDYWAERGYDWYAGL